MDFTKLILRATVAGPYRPTVPEEMVQRCWRPPQPPHGREPAALRILVIGTKGREAELGRIYGREWFLQPPWSFASASKGKRPGAGSRTRKVTGMSTPAIAFAHLILAATELGLGTCWIAAFDPRRRARCSPFPMRSSRWRSPLGLPPTPLGRRSEKALRDRAPRALVNRGVPRPGVKRLMR